MLIKKLHNNWKNNLVKVEVDIKKEDQEDDKYRNTIYCLKTF